jgi:hypothetical protein
LIKKAITRSRNDQELKALASGKMVASTDMMAIPAIKITASFSDDRNFSMTVSSIVSAHFNVNLNIIAENAIKHYTFCEKIDIFIL